MEELSDWDRMSFDEIVDYANSFRKYSARKRMKYLLIAWIKLIPFMPLLLLMFASGIIKRGLEEFIDDALDCVGVRKAFRKARIFDVARKCSNRKAFDRKGNMLPVPA